MASSSSGPFPPRVTVRLALQKAEQIDQTIVKDDGPAVSLMQYCKSLKDGYEQCLEQIASHPAMKVPEVVAEGISTELYIPLPMTFDKEWRCFIQSYGKTGRELREWRSGALDRLYSGLEFSMTSFEAIKEEPLSAVGIRVYETATNIENELVKRTGYLECEVRRLKVIIAKLDLIQPLSRCEGKD